MPSPRAVLADITEFGLNHNARHTVISANGRLRSYPTVIVVNEQKVIVKEEVEEKKEVVKEPEIKVEEKKIEEVKEVVETEEKKEELKLETTNVSEVVETTKTLVVEELPEVKTKRNKKV